MFLHACCVKLGEMKNSIRICNLLVPANGVLWLKSKNKANPYISNNLIFSVYWLRRGSESFEGNLNRE